MGISADPVDRQREFDEKNSLGFTLLSDGDKSIAKQFDVRRFGPLPSKRATFVIAGDGTLLADIRSETSMEQHADDALATLREHSSQT